MSLCEQYYRPVQRTSAKLPQPFLCRALLQVPIGHCISSPCWARTHSLPLPAAVRHCQVSLTPTQAVLTTPEPPVQQHTNSLAPASSTSTSQVHKAAPHSPRLLDSKQNLHIQLQHRMQNNIYNTLLPQHRSVCGPASPCQGGTGWQRCRPGWLYNQGHARAQHTERARRRHTQAALNIPASFL